MCILLYKYYLCMCMCTYWLCVYCKRCSVLYKSTSCSPRTGNVVAFYSVISLASWFQQSQCNFLLLNKQTAVMSRHCGSLQLTYWSRKKNAGCLGSFPGWKQPGLLSWTFLCREPSVCQFYFLVAIGAFCNKTHQSCGLCPFPSPKEDLNRNSHGVTWVREQYREDLEHCTYISNFPLTVYLSYDDCVCVCVLGYRCQNLTTSFCFSLFMSNENVQL